MISVAMFGCGTGSTNTSLSTIVNHSAPQKGINISSNSAARARNDQSYHGEAYPVPNPKKFPAAVISLLHSKSPIPVAVPTSLPKFMPPLPSGLVLAIDPDVSSNGYGMDIFYRPKGSETNQYDMADLEGYITGTKEPQKLILTHYMSTLQHKKSMRLSDGTLVTDYRQGYSLNNPFGVTSTWKTVQSDVLVWSAKNWTYVAAGMGGGDAYTLQNANEIANFISARGSVVKSAKSGFVVADWSGNRPSYVVTWTYTGQYWYSIGMATLSETLSAAKSVKQL